jgi:hypothetical protein
VTQDVENAGPHRNAQLTRSTATISTRLRSNSTTTNPISVRHLVGSLSTADLRRQVSSPPRLDEVRSDLRPTSTQLLSSSLSSSSSFDCPFAQSPDHLAQRISSSFITVLARRTTQVSNGLRRTIINDSTHRLHGPSDLDVGSLFRDFIDYNRQIRPTWRSKGEDTKDTANDQHSIPTLFLPRSLSEETSRLKHPGQMTQRL